MSELMSYFGIDPEDVRKNCIICPVPDHDLFSCLGKSKSYNGLFAKIINYKQATVISTKNNFLVGDIVLYLKNTACENIFLFGSCGGAGNIKIGDKVIIKKAFNFESFSEMLAMKSNPDAYYASNALLEEFLKTAKQEIFQVKCATTNSLILERIYKDWFDKNKVNAVDMECSLVFSASSSINKRAIALLYVTDRIGVAFNEALEQSRKNKLLDARKSLANSICEFIQND